MQKINTMTLAMDTSQAEQANKLISSLLSKVRRYNDQIEKSNRLLREQEQLRKKLGVSVEKGKVKGLVETPKEEK